MSSNLKTIRELVERGPFRETWIKERIASGELPAYQIGPRKLVIDERDYDELIRSRMTRRPVTSREVAA